MARPGKKRKVLFILEIVILLLFIGGLYVYGQISARLDKIHSPEFKREEVVVNAEAPAMTGFSTYAVFGIDSREAGVELDKSNSDTIIIVSVNNDTKEVKMASLYRDTLIDIGSGKYAKSNSAYAAGGPEQAISMLNTNFDLNITDYATADFSALVEVIDELGGLDIPLSYEELVHMNNYCVETSAVTGKSYTKIEEPDPKPADEAAILGTYHLNGVQATSYCRIRYTASLDMGRSERQRKVIGMIVDKAKTAGLTKIFGVMDKVFPMVSTSLSKNDILQLMPTMIGYSIVGTTGFPEKYTFAKYNQADVIAIESLENEVVSLHKFLYGDSVSYTPSSAVLTKSSELAATLVAGGVTGVTVTETPVETYDTGVDDGSYDTSYDDGSYDTSYDTSTDDGSYDDGSYDTSYDTSTDDGSYDTGMDDGSYDTGTDDGSYDTGTEGSSDFSDGYASSEVTE